jgi:5-methyltetrahydropteroyltriglutamate--homocysteine methyltransferase
VPLSLLGLLKGKDVLVGAIDVASDTIETPEDVLAVVDAAIKHVPKEHMLLCTNCGMAPMTREVAYGKLASLAKGAELARKRYG